MALNGIDTLVPLEETRGGRAPGTPAAGRSPLQAPRVRLFLIAVVAAAVVCLSFTPPESLTDRLLLVWILLCFGGEVLWFRTPVYDGTLSLALTLDIAAIACLPASFACLVIAASTLLAGIYPHRRPWYRILFNVAQSAIAATAAAAVFAAVSNAGGVAESQHVPVLGLATAGLVFYGVNTLLVAIVQALWHRRSPLEVWCDSYASTIEMTSTGGQITLAIFVALAYQVTGPASLIGVFPILLALWLGSRTTAQPTTVPPTLRIIG